MALFLTVTNIEQDDEQSLSRLSGQSPGMILETATTLMAAAVDREDPSAVSEPLHDKVKLAESAKDVEKTSSHQKTYRYQNASMT